ncbi:MAG: CRTAC1 family protein, partial [Gemmataceae bacterium]|nr:CRTAC1 family protein [Gemmataceae bacterium]
AATAPRPTRWAAVLGVAALAACVAGGVLAYTQFAGRSDRTAGPTDEKAAEEPPAGPGWFEDVTKASGVDFTYRNGEEAGHYAILESLGGGAALIDYDRDGLYDLFLPGGGHYNRTFVEYVKMADGKPVLKANRYDTTGPAPDIRPHPSRLYKNLGGFRFRDVTAEVGFAQPALYTHGAAVGDYDRDGWPDLVVTGYGGVLLYHNEPDGKGGRTLKDVTAGSGLDAPGHFWGTSAAFGDLDGDGFPELYVCQYANWSWENNPPCSGYTTKIDRDVCPPKQYDAAPHRVYRNLGAGRQGGRWFEDVSAAAGLRHPPRADKDYGKGLGVVIFDADGDGKPDVYVANDTTGNFLYLNRSTPGKVVLEEKGFDLLCSRDASGTPTGSMGVDAGDFDGSGRPSVWVTNYEGELHALYRNGERNGRLSFKYHTHKGKIAALGQNYVGFGTRFVDLDQDGWEDIAVVNGHVIRHPYKTGLRQKPVLLRNNGDADATFADVTARGGPFFRDAHRGRGLAAGDLDNDGRPDLVVTRVNEPAALLRHTGTAANWVGLDLRPADNASPVEARVTVETGGRKLVRFVKGGGSYLSASDPRVLVGLGPGGRVDRVTVEWPGTDRKPEVVEGVSAGRYWRVDQGSGKAAPAGPGA